MKPLKSLTLTAYDFGGKSSSAKISIIVTDINDHDPEILNCDGPPVITVPESQTGLVYTLEANDRDIGDNGNIKFKFSTTVTDSARRIFSLDEKDGSIR